MTTKEKNSSNDNQRVFQLVGCGGGQLDDKVKNVMDKIGSCKGVVWLLVGDARTGPDPFQHWLLCSLFAIWAFAQALYFISRRRTMTPATAQPTSRAEPRARKPSSTNSWLCPSPAQSSLLLFRPCLCSSPMTDMFTYCAYFLFYTRSIFVVQARTRKSIFIRVFFSPFCPFCTDATLLLSSEALCDLIKHQHQMPGTNFCHPEILARLAFTQLFSSLSKPN